MASLWASSIATLLVVLTTMLIRSILGRCRRRPNPPPGPKPWPIIGNFNLMGPLPHRTIDVLSKKYGPIMQLWFGSHPVVVASSAEMAKEFLKTHDLNFASRPKNPASKHLFFDLQNIVWSPYGTTWRQFRRICATELFSAKRINSCEHVRAEELNSMLFHLCSSAGKPMVLREPLFNLNLGIITRMLMKTKCVGEGPESIMKPKELGEMLLEAGLVGGMNGLEDYIPIIRFFDIYGNVKRMKTVRKKMEKFAEQVLDEHIARKAGSQDSTGKEDMVDVLLQLSQETNLETKLTPTQIKAFIIDIMVGGTASGGDTMEWALAELLRCSNIMEKAREELDKVIGKNRWVEEKDLPQLPYIESIMKETFRMHPAGPLLVPHFTQEHCNIAGYDIRAETIALVNVWAIGRDPKIWYMPDEFRPERFIGNKMDVKGQDFELLPFGSGRRMCPGYNLALKVIQLSLANFIHGFVWSLPENKSIKPLNMEEAFSLTAPMREPLVVVVQPRLPAHLYSF